MIEATIARDAEGFPSLVTLQDGAKRLEVAFDRDSGFTITGSRRSFTQELLDMLRMIYPATVDFKLDLPQPLSVVQVQGGKTILYDDMEALLKWEEAAATVALDATNAFNGSQCLELTGAAGGAAIAQRYFPIISNGKVQFETVFTVDSYVNLQYLTFYMAFTSHAGYVVSAGVRYDSANHYWQYFNNVGGWTNFFDFQRPYARQGVGGPWHKVKFSLDLTSRTYVEFQINHSSMNMPYASYFESPVAGVENSIIRLIADAAAAVDVHAWFDDVLVTEVT